MDTLAHFIACQENPDQTEGVLLAVFTAAFAMGQCAYKEGKTGFDSKRILVLFDALLNDPDTMEYTKELQKKK